MATITELWQTRNMAAEAAAPRARVLDAALRLLEAGGPEAVQARKLAAEVGASTMAVYTHFGGMAELMEAMVLEGFVRFAAHVEAAPETGDPMADFFVKGMAYRQWALAHPQLYRLMFGMSDFALPGRVAMDITVTGTSALLPEARNGFEVMTRSIGRVRESGRIADVDAIAAAGQFLSATHGYVLLEMAGYLGPVGEGLALVLAPMGISIMVGFGAERGDVERSAGAALAAVGIG